MKNKRLKPRIIVVCGPTATGKTAAAIALAQRLKGEIIGADSMQIYKHMDIGTAKPTAKENAAVRHYLVDVISPNQPYDAARFAEDAAVIITRLAQRGLVPLIVGGTGLYIKALLHGLFEQLPKDPDLRARLRFEAAEQGSAFLHDRLKTKDPKSAAKIHFNDTYRIIRALEVYELTQKAIVEHHKTHGFAEQPYEALKIGLHMEREALYDRIDKRVDQMLDSGLLDEVKTLLEKGYSAELKTMQSIGYRHMVAYLKGEIEWDEAVRTMKRDTRRYAKRQMTWFKADDEIIWKQPHEIDEIMDLATDFIQS
jgi:tRNA dimethylallyltransferase